MTQSAIDTVAGGGPEWPEKMNALRLARVGQQGAFCLVAVAMWLVPARVTGANWPAWRGPDGSGVCRETSLPLHWSTNQNVRWHVPLPGRGNSTPVVWGNRVFLTQALEREGGRTVRCYDARDGRVLWQAGTNWAGKEGGGSANPPCTPSPVTDGRRVIAWFGSAGVYCYDLHGRLLWHRDLGRQTHGWGYASSPVLYGGLCLLNFGPGEPSFLIALDKRTGETVWRYDVPAIAADAKWEDYGGNLDDWKKLGTPALPEVAGSCATPLVVRAASGDEVVLPLPMRLMAFAPRNGQPLWSCAGPNTGAYASPCCGDGIVAVSASGLRNACLAVRPGGRGEVAATHRLWLVNAPDSKACIGSGVIHHGHLYQVTLMGFAQCLDLRTGQTVWHERLTGSGARNSTWSSLVLAGDRLYLPNQNADVFVLRASPRFECLATNSLGGEPMNASLAVARGAIYLRTDRQLWCVAQNAR
jgi:outer membrane protein assembly factor BamB